MSIDGVARWGASLPAALGGLEAPLDLRALLLALAGLVVLAALGAIAVDRRLRREPRLVGLPRAERLLPLLEALPLGWMLVELPREGREPSLRMASREARRLLGLEAGASALPRTGWGAQLREDLAATGAGGGRDRDLDLGAERSLRWWLRPLGALALVGLQDQSARVVAERSGRTLLGELSHELRTPLATILTHLEVQAAEELPAEVRQSSLRLARDEARRMSRLVQDMLALGRLEAGAALELRPLDLAELAEEALAQQRPQAEEAGLELGYEAEAGLPLVRADADALRRVLHNLLDNALQHGAGGGRARLLLQRRPGGVRCWVEDEGAGIPAAHLPQVSRRFYRVDDRANAPGSGLGLAMVAEILRRHGARLEIESPLPGRERGTRAGFVLPEAGS